MLRFQFSLTVHLLLLEDSLFVCSSIHSQGVHLSCADALIREGANVNKQVISSPFYYVLNTVTIMHPPPPFHTHTQSSDGSTAMHFASSVGAVALIELMALNGGSTDIRDFEGRLPLHWATIQKSSKVITSLLEVEKIHTSHTHTHTHSCTHTNIRTHAHTHTHTEL